MALLPPLFYVLLTAGLLSIVYVGPATAERSISWWTLLTWLVYLFTIVFRYQQFFAKFGTGSRRRARLRDLVAYAYFSADLTKTAGQPGSQLPSYPLRKLVRKRRSLREGSDFERLRDARRWAATAVIRDLAVALSVMMVLTSFVLLALWSLDVVNASHAINDTQAAPTITNDVIYAMLRSVPVLELPQLLGLTGSKLFEGDIVYRLVISAAQIGVIVPTVSTLVSLFGAIRLFNPIDPVVGDSVVRALVTQLASRDLHIVKAEPPSYATELEQSLAADLFVFDVDDSAASTAETLNGQDLSPDKHELWTQENILVHVDRVGVFA